MSDSKTVATKMIADDTMGLQGITSFEDAVAYLQDSGIAVHTTTEYGDGFEVVDKAELVGKEMLILEWNDKKGDYGPMTVVHAVTVDNKKVIFVDGSDKSGVRNDLHQIRELGGGTQGLHVPKGLTVSEYTYVDEKGQERPARTYYLS